MRLLIVLFILPIALVGCGRITPTTSANTISSGRVNESIIGDQKNPNISNINNEIAIVYVDENSDSIKFKLYDKYMSTKVSERTLYTQNKITDGKPEMLPHNNDFFLFWESHDGYYMQKYNKQGNVIGDETLILTSGDDVKATMVDDKIMIVYETNTKNKEVYWKILN